MPSSRSEHVIRSICRLCYNSCGVLITMQKGVPVAIQGDPEHPFSKGKLCPKGWASLEYLNHPDRLLAPLKRAGDRGEGRWEKVSWSEALETVATGLRKIKETYGARSVVFMRGASKGLSDVLLARFANIFGSPNITSPAPYCFVPLVKGSELTYGFYAYPDYEHPPRCIMVWGVNLKNTRFPDYEAVLAALEKGTKLIVIDPVENELTKKAHLWIKLRPGTDLALALGLMKVIIDESLHDRNFVGSWTLGFEELRNHLSGYSLDEIERITWVSRDKIVEAARTYGSCKPACIPWGNGVESNVNSLQTARAICMLRAISGHLGVPGGEVKTSRPGGINIWGADLASPHLIPEEVRDQRLSKKDHLLPTVYYALPQSIMTAILHDDPYPVRAAYVQAANPLTHYPNARETFQALMTLDFLFVSDLFMTPSAMLADVVLPAATYLEYDSVEQPWDFPMAGAQQGVTQVGECRSDGWILNELAGKMGFREHVWSDMKEPLDLVLKEAGLTFEAFKRIGILVGEKRYRHYEREGFDTSSGKVELYSRSLESWGYDPLPVYHEPPETPHSEPEASEEYPLIMTSHKDDVYRHSGGRQIASLRKAVPEPAVRIHPLTAERLRIEEGEWVQVSTRRGTIRLKTRLLESLDPRTVVLDYAWWYPEKKDSYLFAWDESNINVLTSNRPPFNREMGTPSLRGIFCKVSKAEE